LLKYKHIDNNILTTLDVKMSYPHIWRIAPKDNQAMSRRSHSAFYRSGLPSPRRLAGVGAGTRVFEICWRGGARRRGERCCSVL